MTMSTNMSTTMSTNTTAQTVISAYSAAGLAEKVAPLLKSGYRVVHLAAAAVTQIPSGSTGRLDCGGFVAVLERAGEDRRP